MRRKKKIEEEYEPMGEPDVIAVFDNAIEVWTQAENRAIELLEHQTKKKEEAIQKKQDYLNELLRKKK